MLRILSLIFIVFFLSSCNSLVYSPNEVRPDYTDLNSQNLAEIAADPSTRNFKFILVGDFQRFYDEMDDFISHVNTLDNIAFITIAGDLVDFGLNREYNWVGEKLQKLKTPYIGVIGNHDMLANGRKIFNKMFGPENFSFTYGNTKFVCVNTNSREVRFDGTVPDMGFLQKEISNVTEENVIAISHVPPYSGDFDKKLEESFAQTLASQPKLKVSLHGHNHQFETSSPYNDGVTYHVTTSTKKRGYLLVTVNGTNISVEQISF